MIEVILMEPEVPGNIGAIARLMKNFGFKDLTLISPKCSHLHDDSLNRAKHAKEILYDAKLKNISYLKKCQFLVATTSKLGTDYNLLRSPLAPSQLAQNLKGKKGKISILFGREGVGLTNKEIMLAGLMVNIPSSPAYPALNLSHAAAIVFYELFRASLSKPTFTLATKKDMEIIFNKLGIILNSLKFATPQKRQTQKILWKRIFGKAVLTRREAFGVLGLLKKLRP